MCDTDPNAPALVFTKAPYTETAMVRAHTHTNHSVQAALSDFSARLCEALTCNDVQPGILESIQLELQGVMVQAD